MGTFMVRRETLNEIAHWLESRADFLRKSEPGIALELDVLAGELREKAKAKPESVSNK